jgi:hypothetical protein
MLTAATTMKAVTVAVVVVMMLSRTFSRTHTGASTSRCCAMRCEQRRIVTPCTATPRRSKARLCWTWDAALGFYQ